MKKIFFILLSILTLNILTSDTASAATRVSASPSSTTLSEDGGSQIFSISLDEPIISATGTAYVTLNITSTDSRLSFSTTSISFGASEWFTTKYFTTTSINDTEVNSTSSARIRLTSVSNSEYYSGYVLNINTTILDDDTLRASDAPTAVSNILYGCRDTTAKNYDRFSAHMQSLCVYSSDQTAKKIVKETEIPPEISSAISPTTSTVQISRNLAYRMEGEDVKKLQLFLIDQQKGNRALLLKTKGANGYFGPSTKEALIEWQKAVSITPATGIFGPRSKAKSGI